MLKKTFITNINNIHSDIELQNRIERYIRRIDAIYIKYIDEIIKLVFKQGLMTHKNFIFSDYPLLNQEISKLIKSHFDKVFYIISDATEKEWINAADRNINTVKYLTKNSILPKEDLLMVKDRNLDGLKSFQSRKDPITGINLSDRIWSQSKQLKKEIEIGLEISLSEGKSASETARLIKNSLKDPNKLFRKVRNLKGQLVLSSPARSYNPGQGVYRSSFKNSNRVARTEINMAYRSSDYERWLKQSFVVGIKINLSNNPNHCPTCETLAGTYPKHFKFIGWHPQCRCYTTPIMKTKEEIDKDLLLIIRGEKSLPPSSSSKYIKDVPDNFKIWMAANEDRISKAKSVPYWIMDNFIDGNINNGLKF